MKPSVGQIVHYTSYGTPGGEYKSECRAAIVTETSRHAELPDVISLCVLNPEGIFLNRGVPFGNGDVPGSLTPGTWHWPERAE